MVRVNFRHIRASLGPSVARIGLLAERRRWRSIRFVGTVPATPFGKRFSHRRSCVPLPEAQT